MTKQLSDLFQLATDELVAKAEMTTDEAINISNSALTNLEKIDYALTQVSGLEQADAELDELSNMAVDSFKDLSELGMQVDSRFSAEIFNSASTFLGHAITAKTAKINKKLKMLSLQLQKAALDQKRASTVEELEATPIGTAHVLDRNELLKRLTTKSLTE